MTSTDSGETKAVLRERRTRILGNKRPSRTELAQALALLEEQNAALELRVQEHTAKLAEAARQAETAAAASARLYAAAQETQRRLTDIIDFLPDPTLVIDEASRVIAWNRAIEQMTGVAARDMLGKGNYEYAIPFYGERRPILIDLVRLPRRGVRTQVRPHRNTRLGAGG